MGDAEPHQLHKKKCVWVYSEAATNKVDFREARYLWSVCLDQTQAFSPTNLLHQLTCCGNASGSPALETVVVVSCTFLHYHFEGIPGLHHLVSLWAFGRKKNSVTLILRLERCVLTKEKGTKWCIIIKVKVNNGSYNYQSGTWVMSCWVMRLE